MNPGSWASCDCLTSGIDVPVDGCSGNPLRSPRHSEMTLRQLPTVIVPIYNAAEDLDRCLRALHRNSPALTEVLLLDDASDDPRIAPLLKQWTAGAGSRWKLAQNSVNVGFVGTVNRGMRMTPYDVVLLNSDTLVTPGWLEGLAHCLASDERIATATPWTNNGEIASLPRFCHPNAVPGELDEIGKVIGRAVRPLYPDLPTAVGFCMAISRSAIDELGIFDEKAFGLGYGEENDFSMRAQGAGWRNVLCDNVYVAHIGGRSFEPRGIRPDQEAMKRLLARHPGYLDLVSDFIAGDPLATRREDVMSALRGAGIELS